jgi:hypothetical protein
MPAPVEFLGHEAVVPAQEGLGRRQRGRLFEALTPERVGEHREAAAFGLGQTQPSATKLSFEDAVFLAQIIDDLLLVILDPPGNHGDQNVKNHRCSSGWRQSRDRAVQYTLHLSNFNGVETAEIFNHTRC